MLTFPAAAAPLTASVILDSGVENFSVALYVNEATPYAGVEFALTISDESALTFSSFTHAYTGVTPAPFKTVEEQHFFGFFSGSNQFGGSGAGDNVGIMNFTGYKGSEKITITIEMSVTRIVDKQSIETVTSPSHIYTIQRTQASPPPADVYYKVTFVLNGGIRTGGSELVQLLREGDTPDPPSVSRSGYLFDGWEPDIESKIHADMTFTAQWKPDAGGGGGPGPDTGTGTGTDTGSDIPDGWVPLVPGFPFTDVKAGAWYDSDVLYMWQHGLMNGTSATQFSPNSRVKRGMIVTVLYRMEGEPDVSELDNPFTDVADGMYYTNAVIWAAANEIVRGYGNNRFGPNDDVTREQLATMLYRYQEYKGEMAPDVNEARVFADAGKISGFAAEPVATLVKQGIINGKNNNMFDPKGNATRAEYAAMLHRYLLTLEEPEEELPEEELPEEGETEEELPEEEQP